MRGRNAFSLEYLPVLFCCACVVTLFFEILVSGKALYGGDFSQYFQPLFSFVHEFANEHGSLPFWNPYLFSGSPIIGNVQACLFYPLGFPYYLLPADIAYGYSTVLHVMMGLGFMYLFMRSIGVHVLGCLFSAIVFMFNGYFMGHLFAGHLSFVQNYIWIPLIFFFLNRFVKRASLRNAVAAGLFLGFQILGGFPQIAFYTILASSMFILVWGMLSLKEKEELPVIELGAGWAIFVFLGFALAAIQVLPTYEFTKLSTRGEGISYEMATYESLHPEEILAFLLPDIFGNATDYTYWRSREFWHFWESCGYVGILPLFLLFVKAQHPGHERMRTFAWILILFSLFVALGKYNPLYPLIYKLPGFGSFRIPAQIIFLYVFGVAVLSGLGLSRIVEGEWKLTRGFWIFSVLSGLMLITALVGLLFFRFDFFFSLFRHFSEGPVTHANLSLLYERISSTIAKSCLIFFLSFSLTLIAKYRKVRLSFLSFLACVIIFMDLYTFVSPFVRTYEFVTAPEKERLLSQLSKSPTTGRVVIRNRDFRSNDGMMYRYPSIQGYDPLILKKYVDYVLISQDLPRDDHVVNLYDVRMPQAKLIRLLNARQMVSGGEVKKLENEIPYAFVVPEAIVKSEEDILPFMKSADFDPGRTVVFVGEPKHALLMADPDRPFIGSCDLVHYAGEEIRFRTSSNQRCYLVMSEIWYPGWVASVDGKKTEVICGNYLFRVVPLEQGDHDIVLTFVSWPFRMGAAISLLALGLCLCFTVIRRSR